MLTCLLYIFFVQGGGTVLRDACHAGQTTVVTLLLDHGADVHAVMGVGDCNTSFDAYGIHMY